MKILNFFKNIFKNSWKLPTLKDFYILDCKKVFPKRDKNLLHVVDKHPFGNYHHILIFQTPENKLYFLLFKDDKLCGYKFFGDKQNSEFLKDYSEFLNKIEDYPEHYEVLKDDLTKLIEFEEYK